MGFGILGLNSILLPSPPSIIHRSFAKKRNKEVKTDRFEIIANFDVVNLTEHDFLTEIEKVTASFPVLNVNNFFRTTVSKNYPLLERFFYVKLTAGDSCVFALFNKFDCTLVALKIDDSVTFIKDRTKEFEDVADIMVAKDGVEKDKITYKDFGLKAENVSYTRSDLIKGVQYFGKGSFVEEKRAYFVDTASRIQGLGMHSAVFPDWKVFMAQVFENNWQTSSPSLRMGYVLNKWTPLSAFIISGGTTVVNVSGVMVSLKNITGYVSVVNGRSIMNSGAGEPPEFNPWAGKPVSQRKKKLVPVAAAVRKFSTLLRRIVR